jgi:hypothetical protein
MKMSRAGAVESVGFREVDQVARGARRPGDRLLWPRFGPRRPGMADSGQQEARSHHGDIPRVALSTGATLPRGRGRPAREAQVLGLRPAAQLASQRALTVASRCRRPRPTSAPWPASRRRADGTSARLARRALVQFTPADFLEVVRGGLALLFLAGRHPSAELERSFCWVSDGRPWA